MIHFFCALPCEAEPLLRHYDLQQLKQFPLFRIYQSPEHEYSLCITGIGRINAAAAVSYHFASINPAASDIWLNIGVGGHQQLALGEACLANKVSDVDRKNCWYPQLVFTPPCKVGPLQTLDHPSTEYEDCLYDMEAAGFYNMAIRTGTAELVHCLKIISDNEQHPSIDKNKQRVTDLIRERLDVIDALLAELKPLSDELDTINSAPEALPVFLENWRFTQSQKIILSRLLRQWQLRLPGQDAFQQLQDNASPDTVLQELGRTLNETAFHIYD